MAKTDTTLALEKALWRATNKQGIFGCFEVTIGWFGKERVDYMTRDIKGDFRCYEIKVSVSDFHSKSANTFVGDLNYYVMTKDLYNKVIDEIPKGIGVLLADPDNKHAEAYIVRRATRQPLKIERSVLIDSIIRSLSRDADKYYAKMDSDIAKEYEKKLAEVRRERNMYKSLAYDRKKK